MHEDLAVALAAGDRRRRHGDDAKSSRGEVVGHGHHGAHARFRIADDAAPADRLTARFELRLHQRDDAAPIAQHRETRWQCQAQRDEGHATAADAARVFVTDTLAAVPTLMHYAPAV